MNDELNDELLQDGACEMSEDSVSRSSGSSEAKNASFE